jgi:hypothetical protein
MPRSHLDNHRSEKISGQPHAQRLTIKQTATGWWTVRRGAVDVAGSMTRRGAEAERDLMLRLSRRSPRRAAERVAAQG